MLEKRFIAVSPQLFTADGVANGVITVANTRLFKVKQEVVINATSLPTLDTLEIKRINNGNQMVVGPRGANINSVQDVSAYTVALGANIFANEQKRPSIPFEESTRAVYEEEPTVATRSVLVDALGEKIGNVVDNNGINRLAVDGQFHAEVDVQVDVDVDGTYNPLSNPDPDNIGLIGHERSLITGQPQQTQPITAKRGTVDTNSVSMDVSLHDQLGNAYTSLNPLPVSASYEKFFTIIVASKWMELAAYDEVIPTLSNGDNDLILTFKEDGATLGEAVITNFTLSNWHIKLNRYITDDDNTPLQDDDNTFLNLD